MYRNTRNCENLQKRIFDGVGNYGIPELFPIDYDKQCDFVPFSDAKTCKDRENKGVHFFVDDYRFNRLWSDIDRYVDMLSQFKYVMTPDFSIYTDFPKAVQIYNHYRKHWVGAYLQEVGINIIPTISWSTPDSFEWCFDGEPAHSIVAVFSVGSANSKEKKRLFLAGYNEMLNRLEPDTILFYGKIFCECTGNIIHISPFYNKYEKN